MFKIMLVDDEPLILEKLRAILAQDTDCTTVATAASGAEALQQAQALQPQIIFSDIQMPLMNGIELAQALKATLPECLVILISGYNDFAYAQQAIATGVFRYLLKPINPEDLSLILTEAKQQLTLREQASREKKRLQSLIRENLPRLREKFFTDLLAGNSPLGQLDEQLTFLEITPQGAAFGVIDLQLDNYPALLAATGEPELQFQKFRLLSLAEAELEKVSSWQYCFINKPNEVVLVYGFSAAAEPERVTHALSELQNRCGERALPSFSAGLGRLYPEFAALKQSYLEALLALDFKIWTGKNAIIPYQDIERNRSGRLIHLQNHDSFTSLLREGNPAKAELLIDQYFNSWCSSGAYTSKSLLHLAVLDLINQIIRTTLEFNGSVEQVFGNQFDPVQAVNSCESIEDLAGLVKESSRRAVDFIESYKQDLGKNFVAKAKAYLEENYTDPELNLNVVAGQVFVSSCYLSHLFKQVTGFAVTEYLNRIRIRAAQKLLKQTQLKIYEIAEQVGFNDSHYFSIVFKKSTGVSALEYRDKVKVDTLI